MTKENTGADFIFSIDASELASKGVKIKDYVTATGKVVGNYSTTVNLEKLNSASSLLTIAIVNISGIIALYWRNEISIGISKSRKTCRIISAYADILFFVWQRR